LRILWIDNDPRDGTAVFQTDVGPMFAAVSRSINTIAPIGRVAIVRFTTPDPDDIRIRRRNRDRADGKRGLFVENRVERNAAITGFENSAVTERDIKDERIARID